VYARRRATAATGPSHAPVVAVALSWLAAGLSHADKSRLVRVWLLLGWRQRGAE